jgi:hypothetical protein
MVVTELLIIDKQSSEVNQANQCRVAGFGRDPHLRARTVLLKAQFVHSPKVNRGTEARLLEFFMRLLPLRIGVGNPGPGFAQSRVLLPE